MSRRASLLGAAGIVGVAAAAVAAGRTAERRWRRAPDSCGPDGICTPPGDEFEVVTSDGTVLSGTLVGDGPPVVLAHCWTGCRELWGPVARRLVDRGHRVALYDQRGHGRSTLGDADLSVSRLGRDLAELLEHLDLTGAVVAGHSMGGMAAQAFAIEYPDVLAERVEGLGLVATASHGVWPRRPGIRDEAVLASARLDLLMRRPVGLALVRGTVGRVAAYPHLVATRDSFVRTPGAVRAGLLRAMRDMDLRDGVETIKVPTAVMVGGRDGLIPPRAGRGLAEHLPEARLVEFPDAGHMLPIEEPEGVADALAALAGASDPLR